MDNVAPISWGRQWPSRQLALSLAHCETSGSNYLEYEAMIKRFDVGVRMSEMAVYNGVAYLAGQVAGDMSLDVAGQTSQVLAEIDALLARAGTDKSKILRAQIFLADINEFAGMNAVWDAWVPADHTPPRATVEGKLAKPGYRVEIMVTAAVETAPA